MTVERTEDSASVDIVRKLDAGEGKSLSTVSKQVPLSSGESTMENEGTLLQSHPKSDPGSRSVPLLPPEPEKSSTTVSLNAPAGGPKEHSCTEKDAQEADATVGDDDEKPTSKVEAAPAKVATENGAEEEDDISALTKGMQRVAVDDSKLTPRGPPGQATMYHNMHQNFYGSPDPSGMMGDPSGMMGGKRGFSGDDYPMFTVSQHQQMPSAQAVKFNRPSGPVEHDDFCGPINTKVIAGGFSEDYVSSFGASTTIPLTQMQNPHHQSLGSAGESVALSPFSNPPSIESIGSVPNNSPMTSYPSPGYYPADTNGDSPTSNGSQLTACSVPGSAVSPSHSYDNAASPDSEFYPSPGHASRGHRENNLETEEIWKDIECVVDDDISTNLSQSSPTSSLHSPPESVAYSLSSMGSPSMPPTPASSAGCPLPSTQARRETDFHEYDISPQSFPNSFESQFQQQPLNNVPPVYNTGVGQMPRPGTVPNPVKIEPSRPNGETYRSCEQQLPYPTGQPQFSAANTPASVVSPPMTQPPRVTGQGQPIANHSSTVPNHFPAPLNNYPSCHLQQHQHTRMAPTLHQPAYKGPNYPAGVVSLQQQHQHQQQSKPHRKMAPVQHPHAQQQAYPPQPLPVVQPSKALPPAVPAPQLQQLPTNGASPIAVPQGAATFDPNKPMIIVVVPPTANNQPAKAKPSQRAIRPKPEPNTTIAPAPAPAVDQKSPPAQSSVKKESPSKPSQGTANGNHQGREVKDTKLAFARRFVASLTDEKLKAVDLSTPAGNMCLHGAVLRQEPYLVKAILERTKRSESLRHLVNATNNFLQTPLFLAVAQNFKLGVDILLLYQADPNIVAQISQNGQCIGTRAPLHVAVEQGNVEITNCLLKSDLINPSVQDHEGMTPLHIALKRHGCYLPDAKAKINSLPTVQALLRFGASSIIKDRSGGRTPLHYAVQKGEMDLIFELSGPAHTDAMSINTQDFDGNTCLHMAAADTTMLPEVKQRVIQRLLSQGASVKVQNNNWMTPRDLVPPCDMEAQALLTGSFGLNGQS